MRLNFRKIVFLTLILGVLGGGYVFIVVPAYLERRELRTDIRLKKRALADLAVATRTAQELNREAANVRLAIARFTTSLPREAQLTEIVSGLSAAAARNNLRVESVEPARIDHLQDFSREPIHLVLRGD